MNILVTGGTGFIGSHLTEELMQKGHTVYSMVRTPEKRTYIEQKGAILVHCDLSDKNAIARIMEDIEVVYHLASLRGEGRGSSKGYWETNVEGTRNLLDAACKENIKRFVYCSTVGVTGWVTRLPGTEDHQYNPQGVYHKTKYEAEKLSLEYHEKNGVPVTVIRPVITYGPRDDGMIYKLAKLINDGRFYTIGSGENRLHLLYIKNLVYAFKLLLEKPNSIGETYIIADPQPLTVNQLTLMISKNLRVPLPQRHISSTVAKTVASIMEKISTLGITPMLNRSSVDILTKDRYYSTEKANSQLHYQPQYTTEEGIKETIKWLKQNAVL